MVECKDIHTLHAELIHTARDIKFQIAYKNGALNATITDIDQKNVQSALESYFSQVGIPIIGEYPTGDKDSVNTEYETEWEFIPDSLEVFLSGDRMIRGIDYTENGDYKGFQFIIEPEDPVRLNKPPLQFEDLVVNYKKRITFNTKGGN